MVFSLQEKGNFSRMAIIEKLGISRSTFFRTLSDLRCYLQEQRPYLELVTDTEKDVYVLRQISCRWPLCFILGFILGARKNLALFYLRITEVKKDQAKPGLKVINDELFRVEERPVVLNHVFATIHTNRVGITFLIGVSIAVNFIDIDVAFVMSFDENLAKSRVF